MDTTELLRRIERLNEIGIALSNERDTPRLLEMILTGAKDITGADGGTLYTLREDGALAMEILRTDSLGFAMGGTTGEPIPFPPIPLHRPDGTPNDRNVVTQAVLQDRTINIADAYAAEGFDFSGTREFDARTGYRSVSFLTVPMKNHENEIIGVLQLLNAQEQSSGEITAFGPEAEHLTESLASQAAIALTNKRLIEDLERLFDSLTRLIARAIDEKSPYTGDHCRRVPELTMLLADAAAGSADGPLAAFHLSDDERHELEVAAWLHDCGKLTTPEYIVDKATKLETIFDRIEAVETRFEVLKRDAEIAALHRQIAGEADGALEDALAELDEEKAFLRRCNQGEEMMSEADKARVHAIAKRRWRGPDGTLRPLLSDEEVEHLTVERGTLTDGERQVIQNHILSTIEMLESLPFPKHLRRVPEFAGGHHERIDGHGYPLGLTGDQMPVQTRIMAIADVFEALTASDRPYKPGKTLSQALAILGAMAEQGHIDPQLFRLFVDQKVYLDYARRHLKAEQLDLDDAEAPTARPAGGTP